ncbi:MAG: nodulation protein NfeD [Actinobacteria bacterium]|nr:nodulation protein NfeD [Actinomycetota bacterium]MBV8394903.1 nodulation protein NfeD [Actinomycetota bacterium]MBV8598543.1 nodulation protein NfeD [Actinomycetota bacterium]
MKRLLLAVLFVAALAAPGALASPPRVLVIHFGPDLEINPVTEDWIKSQLARAEHGYAAAVIELDTPGGLSTSMKSIYQRELAEKVPVIVYVAPAGARAASAGVWLSQAADVLAMAPISNIGSSTPIDSSGQNIASDLRRKVINDAAASLKALAAAHHRNTSWPVLAVTKASNLTSQQALAMHVIDFIAPTLPALLRKIDGYRTKDAQRVFTLHLAGAQLTNTSPGFLTRLLNSIIDPNIISLLFLAGIVGVGYEIFHPGVVLPGALGAVCLLTSLFGLSVLPIAWTGLALVLLGVALLVIDAHVVTHGALTLAGLVSTAVGLVTLFHNAGTPYHTSVPLVVTVTVLLGGFWAFALGKAVRARRMPVTVGPQEIVGMVGVVRDNGLVFVRGELWRVRAAEPLRPGEHVQVDALDGLTLSVHRV